MAKISVLYTAAGSRTRTIEMDSTDGWDEANFRAAAAQAGVSIPDGVVLAATFGGNPVEEGDSIENGLVVTSSPAKSGGGATR